MAETKSNGRGFDISITDPKERIQAYLDTYTTKYDVSLLNIYRKVRSIP